MVNDFYTKYKTEIEEIAKNTRKQLLEENIPFWENRILDVEYGGYFNTFNKKGERVDDVKVGWFVGRDMNTFSALYRKIQPQKKWLDIAKQGYDFLETSFYAGEGRFNKLLSRKGEVLEGTTSIFTDFFAVKGLFEYLKAIENPSEEQLEKAKFLADKLFENIKKDEILSREGIKPGWQKHAINFMTLLVALESRELFGNFYEDILRECVQKSLYEFVDDELKAPFENVKIGGTPELIGEGRLVDAGHTMESLWFSMIAGEVLNEVSWKKRAAEILDWVIERCYDEEKGGFYQHVDVENMEPEEEFLVTNYSGHPAAWNSKIWWVQAEGLNALFMSALLNENEKHFTYFKKLYTYVEKLFRDKEYGEWYSILDRNGGVVCDYKGFELKGPYHITRCLMEISTFAEKYLLSKKES